jgi:hypothetical protein
MFEMEYNERSVSHGCITKLEIFDRLGHHLHTHTRKYDRLRGKLLNNGKTIFYHIISQIVMLYIDVDVVNKDNFHAPIKKLIVLADSEVYLMAVRHKDMRLKGPSGKNKKSKEAD